MNVYPISIIHAWNCRLVPVFGFPLNALLFWLVWTKTPKEMRVHSRILLQTCIVDLIFLCVELIATPIGFNQASISVIFLDGYFIRIFASIFNYVPMSLAILNFMLGTYGYFAVYNISVQFIYRYLLLNRNMKVSLARYLLMLTVPLVGSLIAAIFYAFGGTTTETIVIDELKASLNDYIDWEKSIYIIGPNNDMFWIASSFGIAICYAINIFCGVKVVKFVGAHAGFNPRMKELNQQLTKTLIILALLPMLSFLLIFLIVALVVAKDISGAEVLAQIIALVQFTTFLIANWVPLINPLVSIWINRPYRDAVRKLVSRLFNQNLITPVQQMNT